jgi:hypothetical protein
LQIITQKESDQEKEDSMLELETETNYSENNTNEVDRFLWQNISINFREINVGLISQRKMLVYNHMINGIMGGGGCCWEAERISQLST